MEKVEIYSDDTGNSITIKTESDGVTVSANIKTKPRYIGGANAAAARSYARDNCLSME